MPQTIREATGLRGTVDLPADKSIGHRTALLSALAEGTSRIENYPASADPQSTLGCLQQLGIAVEQADDIVRIEGRGVRGFEAARAAIDCGNSGTTMRLLTGMLAGQAFDSTLTGDASLRPRPMARIADPLRKMGARVELTDGHAPIHLTGGQPLRGITYPLPVASAQVKSCVLLAGLLAEGETTVIETSPSRDHTERMLGLDVMERDGRRHLSVQGGRPVEARTWTVPGDFSAAAFLLVAGSLVPDSELHLPGVGLNPTRCALLDVLQAMGADLTLENERVVSGEPIGDLTVRTADGLEGVTVEGRVIPNLIDEIPVLAVAAACAEGRTEIRDAAELRVKETDRLAAMATNLQRLGASVEEREDGLTIEGGRPLHGTSVQAFDDHRIAMAMGIAGLVAQGTTTIEGGECARISFPGFWETLDRLLASG